MKLFIVMTCGATFPAGTILRKYDEGFSKVITDVSGKITGTEELLVPHLSLMPFILPYNLKDQWEYWGGQAYHRGSKSGCVGESMQDAVFNQPVAGDDLEDPEEFM